MVREYYAFNKYYLTEPAKDALHNAADCMALILGKRDYLAHNFSGCDSYLPYITQLAYDKYFTEGSSRIQTVDTYNSHNTTRLDVEGMKQLLLKLKMVRQDLELDNEGC